MQKHLGEGSILYSELDSQITVHEIVDEGHLGKVVLKTGPGELLDMYMIGENHRKEVILRKTKVIVILLFVSEDKAMFDLETDSI